MANNQKKYYRENKFNTILSKINGWDWKPQLAGYDEATGIWVPSFRIRLLASCLQKPIYHPFKLKVGKEVIKIHIMEHSF